MTILNTINTPIYEFAWTPFAIIAAIVLGGALLALIAYIVYCTWVDSDIGMFLFSGPVLLLIPLVCVVVMSLGATKTENYNTSYQVIFNEPQDMTELANKYEILDVQGQIYTIKEID